MIKAIHTDADWALCHRFVRMNRYGVSREIGTVAAVLIDDTKSGYVTEEIISVDGG